MTKTLTIGTLNVDGIKTNAIYINKLLDNDLDLLCIQEHWLMSYEKHLLGELLPRTRYIIKSADKHDPVIRASHGRGHGGVAILWRDPINHLIDKHEEEGDERTTRPLMIANTYMPAARDNYADVLAQATEISAKYGSDTLLWIRWP